MYFVENNSVQFFSFSKPGECDSVLSIKIVLMVAHDPILMLLKEQRVIIKNSSMEEICVTFPDRGVLNE